MDICLPLSNRSANNDWETRYALRSMEKHYSEMGTVWVIGHCPRWLDKATVRHIPLPDPYRSSKDANIIGKILAVTNEAELTAQFILLQDDQVILKPVTAVDFQPYWLEDRAKDSEKKYDQSWQAGRAKLEKAGFPGKNFESHCPVIMDKARTHEVFLRWDYGAAPGVTVFTIFFNTLRAEGAFLFDKKWNIRGAFYSEEVEKNIVNWKFKVNTFLSYNDNALKNRFWKGKVEGLFPERSRFESRES